jgi:2-polyprenyl-3-methyl-5-hydroxy-6-metoxy-1,4-benzoquinol methylase
VRLVCPHDREPLEDRGESLICPDGHEYACADGIPVLVVGDLEPTQPAYWATPEQVEEVRRQRPPDDEANVDPYVAKLIVGTHGNLYRHLAGGLPRYPIPRLPLPEGRGRTLLDVGCNWGRWSIAAARAGYRTTGIDPSFEAIDAAVRIARRLGVDAEYAVADARRLPFADRSFDVVFSYGVLQHFPKEEVLLAVREIARVLKPGGRSWVQMANAFGLLNRYRLARRRFREGDRFEVRYWRPAELREIFGAIGETTLAAEGFFTLNPQQVDLDLLRGRHRVLVRASEALRRVRPLTPLADSVSVRSRA